MIAPSTTLRLLRTILVVGFVAALCFDCLGQEASRPDRGVMPNGSYSVSDIENINVLNGNVNIRIPLASLPPIAGGKLSWTITAQYNSKIWNTTREQQNDDPISWAPYTVSTPGADSGWSIGRGYTIFFRNANDDFQRLWYPGNSNLPQWELDLINNYQWWKVVLRMPDGSEHELRPTDYSSYIGGQDFLRGFYNVVPNGSPMRYHSADGTYLFARITSTSDWTIYLPDGTQVIQTPDAVQRIQDTNGNKIKIWSDGNGTHYQDEQTLREIRLTYNPAGGGQYQVWYNTVTGIAQHIDINLGTTTVQGKLYSIQQPGCGQGLTQELYSALEVVREIVFPQTEPGQPQRRFTFSYNSDTSTTATDNRLLSCPGTSEPYTRAVSTGLGELSRMVTPSGGIVDYSYNYDGVTTFEPFGIGDYLSQETITQKKLTHDGTIDTWTYDIGDSFGIVTGPDGSVSSESAYCSLPNTPGCASDKSGLTYLSVRPFTRVERHWINLMFSGSDNRAPNGVIPFNSVVDKEYTTLTDAQGTPLKMSAKASSFDYNGNVIQETFYDWFDPALVSRDAVGVPTGVPAGATVLKVVNYSHYNQAASSSSGNVYAKRSVTTGAPLILNALQQTTLGSSIVQFSYDSQGYGVAPTVGNLTMKKIWDDLDSKWITTSTSYDLYGNVSTSTDGRGKVTQFFYDDATHALPTSVVVDPQNGTATQTTTTAYDFSTGLVTNQTDVNNQITTINYTNQLTGSIDPFGRPGFTEAPQINIAGINHKRRVTTTYLDSARQIIVETDLNAQNDKLLKTKTTADQLGRAVLTEQTEDGTNYTISVRNAYLDMGRVTLTSSAMRSTAASTDGWTRVTKDTAGRVKEVATFGGATQPAWSGTSGTFTGAITTEYEAQFTTVTDQAGKKRRSKVDALGQLIRVDEPDANGNLGSTTSPVQPTDYGYNVFGNLTTVTQTDAATQVTQTRTFTYDSLSRLRSAVNPESGTITYEYDDNGNLLVKKDARNVSTHFEYDALNRVTRRWYNGSNLITSVTHNSPALPAGVGATDEAKFYYDSQPLPPGAPTYDHGSAIGRLVAQTYGSATTGDYFGYDVLGRAKLKIQRTGTIDYQLTAEYKLSGAVSTLTYPSGHTVTNSYDLAGRLTGLTGNLGDGTTRTYSSETIYAATGGLVKEKFGTTTAVYNKLFYNSRGQLAEIRASTSYTGPTDYDWNRGAIINSYSDQCTGICSGSVMPDNNGNLKRQDIYIPNEQTKAQQYSYDSLNRIQWARELVNNTEQWRQWFKYDRWGNRTIDNTIENGLSRTYGVGINNKAFTVNAATNQLGVPSGQSGVMSYDAAGNLTNDTYTGVGNRTYDGENRITSAWGGNNQAQLYSYDATGQRIKRTVNGVETWQVYGFGGELVAEYAANGAVGSPQKEYGYRNGQLLVTAAISSSPVGSPPSSGLVGYWKFDENSGTTAADSSGNNNTGTLISGAAWATGQSGAATSLDGVDDYVQMGAPASLVLTNAGSLSAWIYPTGPGSLATYGGIIIAKEGEYEVARFTDGTIQWALANTNPGWSWINTGYVAPLNQWTHVAVTYDNGVVKTYINGTLTHTYSGAGAIGDTNTTWNDFRVGGRQAASQNFQGRIDEVRVYNRALSASEVATLPVSTPAGQTGYWKFDENSGTTAADSSGNNNTGTLTSGAAWATGQSGAATSLDGVDDYVQMGAPASLVLTNAGSLSAWIYPTGPGSLATYGGIIIAKEGEYEVARFTDGTIQWALANTNPGWSWINTGYVAPLNQWTHVAVTYDNGVVKTYINGTLTHTYAGSGAIGDVTNAQNDFRVGGRQAASQNFQGRIDEVRVYNRALSASEVATLPNGPSSSITQINWLLTDHLGTPRMVLDQTGNLSGMKRHDYLPFGEELFGGTAQNPGPGGRTNTQGYAGDGVRQQFTRKERDVETGLDYFGARYYASTQGRFTSLDPIKLTIARLYDPQRINLYIYCRNDPLKYLDPDGEDLVLANKAAKSKVEQVVFTGLKSDERANVTVKANKVVLVDASKQFDASTVSPAYKYLSQILRNRQLTVKFYGVEKGDTVGLADGTKVTYQDAYKANGITTGAAGDSVREVIIPIGGGPLVQGTQPGEMVSTPDYVEFAHEAYGHALDNDAIAVENEYRASDGVKLPLRSGADHQESVTVTSSPDLITTDSNVPATYIQLKPTKKPE